MKEYSTVIKSKSSLFDLRFQEAWNYRDLLLLLVRRDFVSFYKQTILGPIWFFVQPLFTTITYVFIFGNLAGISTEGVPQPLFYMAGITAWNYFAECLTKTASVFKDNANIFGKVYFPRIIMPLSIVLSNLVRFAVQFFLFSLLLLYYSFSKGEFLGNYTLLFFPFIVLQLALLGLGSGMLISALTTKYRDLAFLLTFGVQLLMYSTTVVYPLSAAPEKYTWLIALNPMTSILEGFRYAFLGQGSVSVEMIGLSWGITLTLFIVGVIVFNRVEKNFVDTV